MSLKSISSKGFAVRHSIVTVSSQYRHKMLKALPSKALESSQNAEIRAIRGFIVTVSSQVKSRFQQSFRDIRDGCDGCDDTFASFSR